MELGLPRVRESPPPLGAPSPAPHFSVVVTNMAKKQKPFATEAALCAAFAEAIPKSWTCYAETGGWDILLVRGDGYQLGIQAKLRLNAEVLAQAIEGGQSYRAESPGPDYRAVLVPWDDAQGFDTIAGYAGITIIRMIGQDYTIKSWRRGEKFRPLLPAIGYEFEDHAWFDCCPSRRHELPEYVPDVTGGKPSPLQLTTWKIAAIKLAITLEERGYITRADFKHIGIDYRRWISPQTGWLSVQGQTYVRGPHMPDLKKQHPVNYQQIKADQGKWMRQRELPQAALPL